MAEIVRIGVPTEIKAGERRVALTPAGARELIAAGHELAVQVGAGNGAGFGDEDYRAEGAMLLADAAEVFAFAELIVKVKEPQPPELALLEPRHTLFTYLHLAADPDLARALAATGATGVAYETVQEPGAGLVLLAPMSEIAGRIAVQLGAQLLLAPSGGVGRLLGGVPGTEPARVTIIGAGVVGEQAAVIALGLGAHVTLLDRSLPRLRALEARFDRRVTTVFSTDHALERALAGADVVIGAVLVIGARAPRLVTRAQLPLIAAGGILVDVAIDQGGCFETSRATTHADPVYEVDGVRHCAVANLPAAAPVTATRALTNATLPYVRRLADVGVAAALDSDPALRAGLNTREGEIVHPAVAEAAAVAA